MVMVVLRYGSEWLIQLHRRLSSHKENANDSEYSDNNATTTDTCTQRYLTDGARLSQEVWVTCTAPVAQDAV